MANTFKFFGSFDKNHKTGTNPILAFTFGKKPHKEFVSWESASLQILLERIVSGVETKMMFLHVPDNPREAWKMQNFNLYNGRKEDNFFVHILLEGQNLPGTTVTFRDIEIKTNFKGAGLQLVTLDVKGDFNSQLDISGVKA